MENQQDILENDEVMMKIVLTGKQADAQFKSLFCRMSERVHECAKSKGFWDDNVSDGEKIALLHSELSEVLEALRKDNPPDDKLNDFSSGEVELADLIIRAMDFAEKKQWKLADAIVAKHEYNLTRPFKHDKKF